MPKTKNDLFFITDMFLKAKPSVISGSMQFTQCQNRVFSVVGTKDCLVEKGSLYFYLILYMITGTLLESNILDQFKKEFECFENFLSFFIQCDLPECLEILKDDQNRVKHMLLN